MTLYKRKEKNMKADGCRRIEVKKKGGLNKVKFTICHLNRPILPNHLNNQLKSTMKPVSNYNPFSPSEFPFTPIHKSKDFSKEMR